MPLTGPEKNRYNASGVLTPEAKDFLVRYAAQSRHKESLVVKMVLQAWYKGDELIEPMEKQIRAEVENQIALGMPPPEKADKSGKPSVSGIVGKPPRAGTLRPNKPEKPAAGKR